VQLAAVKKVDKAREIGRCELLAQGVTRELEVNKSGKYPTPAPASEWELAQIARVDEVIE
jgi:hypothetical protein